jgi:hypothetical protein
MTDHTRRRLLTICVVSAAFFIGMATRGMVGRSPNARLQRGDHSAVAVTPGPTRYRDGVPQGFAQTKDGARAAAVAYVVTGQALLSLTPALVDDAVRSMSAVASADRQVTAAQNQLERLREVLASGSGPTKYVQGVLATRVDAFTADRARVSVWSVGVLSRRGVAAPQAGWTTSAFELVWERGDWKVWSETITPGPAPALNAGVAPTSSDGLESALDGFTAWEPRP